MKIRVLWKGEVRKWCVVDEKHAVMKSELRTYYLAKDWAKAQGYEVVK